MIAVCVGHSRGDGGRDSGLPEGGAEVNERGYNVFRIACDAADTEACVRALESYAWRDLYSWLLQNYTENGIRGQLLGLMLVEGAARYAAARSGQDVPTTNGEGKSE